jgi:RNA polymerase sigma-70 factor (ECF subfamily)
MGAIDLGVPAEGRLPSEDVIVARVRAGDEAMFALLLDTWSSGMLRAARAYVSGAETAEDVVQDTWLAVIRGIDRFEGRSSLRTWVYRILLNTAKTRGGKDGRLVPVESLTSELTGPTVDDRRFQGPEGAYPRHWREPPAAWPPLTMATPETELLSGEMRSEIDEAISALPTRQRIVITLRDLEGYGSEEVRAILDISAANQRVLLHRARAAVRARLERYFGGRRAS